MTKTSENYHNMESRRNRRKSEGEKERMLLENESEMTKHRGLRRKSSAMKLNKKFTKSHENLHISELRFRAVR